MIKKIVVSAVILIVLVIAYKLITRIIGVTKSGERLSQVADVVYKLEAENRQLQEKLSRIQSYQFMEEVARNKLGLSKKGETLIIIPEEKLKLVLGVSSSAQVRFPNWLGWLKVFFK